MLAAWMAPAEIGASDLPPNATVQPVRGAVGSTATGGEGGCCDKPTLPPYVDAQGELWKGLRKEVTQ